MSFSIRNTEVSGSIILNNTSTDEKSSFVQEGNAPTAEVVFPTLLGDVILTDDLLIQATRNLWVDSSSMSGGSNNLALPSSEDTATEARRYLNLFNLVNLNDSVTLRFPYVRDAPATQLQFTVLHGTSFNHIRVQTKGSAYGNTGVLAVTSAVAQNSFAEIQVRADNVTSGSEIISFNIAKQSTA